ncbi:TPA: ribokinase [Candidatus Poribacteria bacterium]|nr:ribokinase [Candidatus Poribacteria bacterium]
MSKIAVFGSINMDLVMEVERFPRQGETVAAKSFSFFPGGKGANQAVGIGRLGGDVSMFGMVGDDTFGELLIKSLRNNGINVENVIIGEGTSSGIASITVDRQGNNTIVITPGANGKLDRRYVDTVLPQIAQNDILLLQFEVPLETIDYLLKGLPPKTPLVILDPAPAYDLERIHAKRVDLITPNETELQSMTGIEIKSVEDIKEAAGLLSRKMGIEVVICKSGDKGSYLITRERFKHFPAYEVEEVDTTAAGDAFNAGLALALSEGRDLEEAIRYANAVGALATTVKGAQPSMPSADSVEEFLKREEVHLEERRDLE